VENLENVEISERERFKAARDKALKEFFANHKICSPSHCCWNWPRYKTPKGYGTIIFDGFKFSVHRLSFEHYKGAIPKNLLVMHECDNPACFNPKHLFLGTHADNMQDMVRKGRHAAQVAARISQEEQNEPGLLKKLNRERENISWFTGRTA
jgi:hypothetical protein